MANEKRLIDAEPICDKCGLRGYYNCTLCKVGTAPTVDAVEVVHGRIEEVEIVTNYMWKYRCSCCLFDAERWYNYCPNCGAKMDGDGNG